MNEKTWILLNEDMKTPYLFNVGGASRYDEHRVGYCVVKAKDRKEAIKYFNWFLGSIEIRPRAILDPMVIELKSLDFTPAKIIYV